jgi:mRNA interferase HigB
MEKAIRFADSRVALQTWLKTAKYARWGSLQELQETFPATDMIGKLAIFNITGNKYRLIARVEFSEQRIFIKEFLTHAEYDKGGWKKWL